MINLDKLLENFLLDWYKQTKEIEDYEDGALLAYNQWLDTPCKELNNLTPRKYVEEMSDEEVLKEFSNYKNQASDPPELICDAMVDRPSLHAELAGCLRNNTSIEFKYLCANLLREVGYTHHYSLLVDWLLTTSEPSEKRALAVEFLMQEADRVAPTLISCISVADEQTKEMIADVLYSYPHEQVYHLLVDLFLGRKNIPLYCAYLAQQGDPRAIEVLKSVAKDVKKHEYLEIRAAVERLGGEMED